LTKAKKPKKGLQQKNWWQVEESFSFLNFRRGLFREVEKNVKSVEAMLQIESVSFIINYL